MENYHWTIVVQVWHIIQEKINVGWNTDLLHCFLPVIFMHDAMFLSKPYGYISPFVLLATHPLTFLFWSFIDVTWWVSKNVMMWPAHKKAFSECTDNGHNIKIPTRNILCSPCQWETLFGEEFIYFSPPFFVKVVSNWYLIYFYCFSLGPSAETLYL